ncbi:hypothetical protein [Granulicella sibirica]|uniref:Uncharacterized protein n=1 Tax=Granulicella sibirica TaxID=2479048 RepID=A0A4Q0T8B6_9BACT|nr:hypothetical protein GRAN_2280 [Granulicella sibirica]
MIDFDAVMHALQSPLSFNPEYSSIDHLHPNDEGYKVMADSIRLNLFDERWE